MMTNVNDDTSMIILSRRIRARRGARIAVLSTPISRIRAIESLDTGLAPHTHYPGNRNTFREHFSPTLSAIRGYHVIPARNSRTGQ
ncbi:hypothetical protein X777_16745 [Ooceraea biroi]|uniref:Uncharacterized protein n=1 Tax=Ooceraea biroi TaxID=2015173 RepID=A0A026VTQ9_OOCBI|nr:hypothetical protein X777_16745 [Ooceraea biroi]